MLTKCRDVAAQADLLTEDNAESYMAGRLFWFCFNIVVVSVGSFSSVLHVGFNCMFLLCLCVQMWTVICHWPPLQAILLVKGRWCRHFSPFMAVMSSTLVCFCSFGFCFWNCVLLILWFIVLLVVGHNSFRLFFCDCFQIDFASRVIFSGDSCVLFCCRCLLVSNRFHWSEQFCCQGL